MHHKSETSSRLSFEDIHRFFRDLPPIHLTQELAASYVLSILIQKDSYGSELIRVLEREHSIFRVSDTVIHSVLRSLLSEGAIGDYEKKVEGRGRPRRMFKLHEDWRPQAEELAQLWYEYSLSLSKAYKGR